MIQKATQKVEVLNSTYPVVIKSSGYYAPFILSESSLLWIYDSMYTATNHIRFYDYYISNIGTFACWKCMNFSLD